MEKTLNDLELLAVRSYMQETEDSEMLANIGYKQDLKRSFSLFSMLGFTFSIVSCWNALGGSLAQVMLNGGPAVLVFGWIGVCALSLFVVLILADLCSAYPVAGGQYSWCLSLGTGTKWGRFVSYVCGWVQLAGCVGMIAVGCYQIGLIITSLITMTHENFVAQNWIIALIAYAVALISLFVSLFGNSILNKISTASLWTSVGGFLLITITILACAPKFQPASFVFQTTTNEGLPNLSLAIIAGLMQSAYGMCCYDSVSHLSEETSEASKQCPRAMWMCLPIGFLTGLGFILAILFCIQDLETVITSPTGYPLLEIIYQSTGSKAGTICLMVICIVVQLFTCISLTTNAARSMYAFARDGAFPFSINKWLMQVSPTLTVPVWSTLVTTGICCGLIAILFGSSTAFFTVLSIASTGLYLSYLITVLVYILRRKNKAPGYYNLGKWGAIIQYPAAGYLLFCCIFFFYPTEEPVTAENMNYDIVAFGIVVILILISWFCGASKTYISEIGVLYGEEVTDTVTCEKVDKLKVET